MILLQEKNQKNDEWVTGGVVVRIASRRSANPRLEMCTRISSRHIASNRTVDQRAYSHFDQDRLRSFTAICNPLGSVALCRERYEIAKNRDRRLCPRS